jgi:hypothetical protein
MVRKWSTGPISLSYTTPPRTLVAEGVGVRVAALGRVSAPTRLHLLVARHAALRARLTRAQQARPCSALTRVRTRAVAAGGVAEETLFAPAHGAVQAAAAVACLGEAAPGVHVALVYVTVRHAVPRARGGLLRAAEQNGAVRTPLRVGAVAVHHALRLPKPTVRLGFRKPPPPRPQRDWVLKCLGLILSRSVWGGDALLETEALGARERRTSSVSTASYTRCARLSRSRATGNATVRLCSPPSSCI